MPPPRKAKTFENPRDIYGGIILRTCLIPPHALYGREKVGGGVNNSKRDQAKQIAAASPSTERRLPPPLRYIHEKGKRKSHRGIKIIHSELAYKIWRTKFCVCVVAVAFSNVQISSSSSSFSATRKIRKKEKGPFQRPRKQKQTKQERDPFTDLRRLLHFKVQT